MAKLYYSISEVAEMFKVNASLLRFWEKEFDILSPRKNDKGTRFYTEEDIKTIKNIYHLLKVQGLKLEGAKQKLKSSKEGVIRTQEIYERLTFVRKELVEIRSMITQFSGGDDLEEIIENE